MPAATVEFPIVTPAIEVIGIIFNRLIDDNGRCASTPQARDHEDKGHATACLLLCQSFFTLGVARDS
jgi:hypothetical protein